MNVVKRCTRPPTGTIVWTTGGAEVQSIGLGFNLDSPDTSAEIAKGFSPPWKHHYFSKYTISLQPGAQQVLSIFSYTTKAACTFRYQATVLDGDKKVYELIGNGNEPFRATLGPAISGTFSAYKAAYVGTSGVLSRVNPKTY
jgi:hypothetical protein